MKTLAFLAVALALPTSAAFARDVATYQDLLSIARARVATLDGQANDGYRGPFVLDNNTWQTYLNWHQEARLIQPAVCNGDCAARPAPARISLTHPY
ncbi:MAG: hypothetical protein HYZ17_10665 [Betaproteobacteria bacterium]|nr:hypothetical protein [Betaproteobacteria bacterium]